MPQDNLSALRRSRTSVYRRIFSKNLAGAHSAAAKEGHKIYMSLDCSSCHGGGGDGMAAPLTNPIWIYGNDDDTLFRLIVLGTMEFQNQGYSRKRSEFVVGPMPPFGETIKTQDDLWKIVAWIRSVNSPFVAALMHLAAIR